MNETDQLLARYAKTGSESDFRELVERHVGLVYSAALRKVAGDPHLAEDIAQTVFTDLARKARSLPSDIVLAGWLYRHACLKAAEAVRRESRRRVREQIAAEMNSLNSSEDGVWREVAPVLDEAMQQLNASDRDALVLRFFQNASLRAVGEGFSISEDAAQKRITRALGKLRALLARHGVTCTATALTTTLSTHAAPAVPAGLAAALSSAALASAATSTSLSFLQIIALMTKAKTILVGGLVLVAATTIFLQQRQINHLREQARASLASSQNVVSPSEAQNPLAQRTSSATTQGLGAATTGERIPTTPDVIARARAMISGRVGLRNRDYSRLLDTLRQLPLQEIPNALAAVMQLPDADQRRWLSEGLVVVWAELDGRAAISWMLKNLPADAQRRRLPEILSDWAAQEPAAAVAWLREFNASQDYGPNLPPGFRQALFENLAEGMSERHFDQALALWSELSNPGEKSSVFRGLLRHAGSEAGRQRLADFIAALPDVPARRDAQSLFISTWAFMDLPGAARYVERFDHAQERATHAATVGRHWLEYEPEPAVAWWLKQATEETRARVMEEIALDWARQHPTKTAEWLNQAPAGPDRDRAVSAFARSIADRYPETALVWAESISDATRREEAVVGAFRLWKERNPDAAQQFLNTAGWTPERVARIASPSP